MVGIETRLKQIEIVLWSRVGISVKEPEFIDLLDLPKETVIGAFGVLKEAMQGQCMLRLDPSENGRQAEYIPFDQFTPEQIYDLMEARRAHVNGDMEI
jgi:hypothetical protein